MTFKLSEMDVEENIFKGLEMVQPLQTHEALAEDLSLATSSHAGWLNLRSRGSDSPVLASMVTCTQKCI